MITGGAPQQLGNLGRPALGQLLGWALRRLPGIEVSNNMKLRNANSPSNLLQHTGKLKLRQGSETQTGSDPPSLLH